jgi:tRNA pseudouridine55 synthase
MTQRAIAPTPPIVEGRPIDGLLLVDKPAGVTSHDVVAVARRALGVRRIGHAGTLDPFATGLLVLLVGRATRLLPYVDGEPKVYDAVIQFGSETDTDDVTGTVIRAAPVPPPSRVDAALASLAGVIDQLPPAFSAKQVGGRRAHAAARGGAPLELRPARVTVHEWRVTSRTESRLEATIVCSGGTYIRALARDLGRGADSAAHLAALRRCRSGSFAVEEAVSLDALRSGSAHLRPPIDAVRSLPAVRVGADDAARVRRGQAISAHESTENVHGAEIGALVTEGEVLLAIAQRGDSGWQPRVVMEDP